MSDEQQDQEVTEAQDSDAVSPQEVEDSPESGASSEAAITGELRRMGERLASAIRAATGTPEAEDLRGEVGDGLRKLRAELEGVLRRGKEAMPTTGAGDEANEAPAPAETDMPEPAAESSGSAKAASVQSTVRNEIANALRSLNGALDRLAGSISSDSNDDEDVNAG